MTNINSLNSYQIPTILKVYNVCVSKLYQLKKKIIIINYIKEIISCDDINNFICYKHLRG